MKKLLIITTILLCSIYSFGRDTTSFLKTTTSTINTLADSSKLSFSKVYTDVKAGITGLASALKVGAEHVYIVLVRQQIVNAIIWLIVGIIGFIFVLNSIKMYKSTEKWLDSDDEFPTGLGIFRLTQILFGLLFSLIFVCHIDTIITGFVNPEYSAIREIIGFIK